MELRQGLSEFYKLTKDELDISLNHFVPEVLPAKEYFVKQGKVSNKIAYLESGILRSFFFNENGDDITTHFFQPDQIVISMKSFNNQVPAKENIITLEDCNLLIITYDKMMELYERLPVWREITKTVDEIKYNNLVNRSIQLQTLSALERYQLFCQKNPLIIQRVPLKHIASYLGIDIATLSRLRKKN